MTGPDERPDYRQTVYGTYVSQKVSRDGLAYTESEYQRWAAAGQHRLGDWLPAAKETPILDLGCGAGHFLYMCEHLGYTHLTGVDLSPEQVALAQRWCPRSNIIMGDVLGFLSEHTGDFGLVTGFDIIEHFRKDELFPLLSLVMQALRPGGRLILQTPNAESPWGAMHRYHDLTHEVAFDPHSLEHVLRIAGFVDFAARECGPYAHGLRSLVRTLLWKGIHGALELWNLVETGGAGSGIYTRVFVASAVTPGSR